ncbi:hypothetical protein ASG87_06795 [Frateuria sp. Soil773]|uniref:serine/threonine-protein kinase n=1 Tax=Frateuria sp. Soil773 TaxID=1736407 RepID=UPI000700544B|nr:serine/threonine-protein kinase [Frateuria sp. Soil773]KRE88319.1 hypothetical protein ASG87_06795 [Frateuria sp. Soil773]
MNETRRRRYALAKPIACAALDMDTAERDRYVAASCGGDASLRDEVRWLIEAADVTGDAGLLPLPPEETADASGSRVTAGSSRYRILRPLGEGGMGVVYLAERVLDENTPDEVRQPVALKFLNAGRAVPGLQRRFAEERRILATLSHPGIAHLIDGGSTLDGRPFLALEYVEGERIDTWCERRQLSLRERVQLFLKVCAPVRHAHQHLVIHRDIKPANILVTPDGEPKLLDFGIARLLDQAGIAAERTMTAQRALTLAYASPEQVRGRPLGTAADVWSLGVVLYQLLCGARPFDGGEEDSPLDLSNAIVTGQPLPPSRRLRRARPAQAPRQVPADLDAIVLKALRCDPAERYASVDHLCADLRRFLALRPVQARRGRHWYRARLFMRRHRFGLGMAALLVLMLAGAVAQREVQLRQVESERDKTQAIAGFMRELFENADPTHARGSHATVREVLDRGAAQLLERRGIEPAVRVSLLLSMARSYNQLSLGGQAIPLLLKARELQRGYDAGVLERGEVMAALGRAYSTVIDLSSAIPADRQAIELLSKAPGDHADEILRVRINLLYNHLGVLDVPLERISGEIGRIIAELEASPRPNRELHLQALAVLGMAQATEGKDAAAMATARRALDEAGKLYVHDDPMLIYYRFTLALVSMRADPAGAVGMYRQAIDDYDHMIGTPGPGLAGLLSYFGSALGQLGQPADAVQALERALRIADGFAASSPDFYLGTLNTLAQQYLELGRGKEAAALLEPRLRQLRERVASRSAWATTNAADAFNVLGAVALQQGRAGDAARAFHEAQAYLGSRERQVAPDSYAASLAGLGESALAAGRLDQAAQWLAALQAFNRDNKATSPGAPALDAALLAARLDIARGDFAEAGQLAAANLGPAGTRWGECSRRAMALRRLERTARASDARAEPASTACVAGSAVSMR